jgi:hypothetical protein
VRCEYWIHEPSGLVWAVQFKDDALACVAGPLYAGEADVDILTYLDYSRQDLPWIEEHRDEFRVMFKLETHSDRPET